MNERNYTCAKFKVINLFIFFNNTLLVLKSFAWEYEIRSIAFIFVLEQIILNDIFLADKI